MTIAVPIPEAVEVAVFEVPGEPMTKGRARMYVHTGRVAAYTPERTRAAELAIVTAMVEQAADVILEDDRFEYEVVLRFVSLTRQRRDVDNMAKLVLDALNHRVWADDAQVVRVVAEKVHGAPPRTVVRISRVGLLDRPVRSCPRCGSVFRMYDSWSARRFCTRECAAEAARRSVTRHCWRCGVAVVLAPAESRRVKQAYCSTDHRFGNGGRPQLPEDGEDPVLVAVREHERERKAQRRIRAASGEPVRAYRRSGLGKTVADGATTLLQDRPQTTRDLATKLAMSQATVRRILNRDPAFVRVGMKWALGETLRL